MTTGEDTRGCDYFTSLFLLPQLCNSTFLLNQLDLDPTLVMEALENQARATSDPRLKVAEIVARLDNCQAHLFATAARGQPWRIAPELR